MAASDIVTPSRRILRQGDVAYNRPVSEAILSQFAATNNFIHFFQYDTKAFFLNGDYRHGDGQEAVDGLYVFPFDCTIIKCAMFNMVSGSGGTTVLDVKRATVSGGSFSTIFSTTPKISASAGNNAFILTDGSGAGLTAPVLIGEEFEVNAGDAIRLDILQVQTGYPQNCGLIIYLRPR